MLTGEDPERAAETLAAARPTAVNLAWALNEVRRAADPVERARRLHEEELERCRRMAKHAASLFAPGSRVLTHCNAGGLATGGYGTAVGAIRKAWEDGLVRFGRGGIHFCGAPAGAYAFVQSLVHRPGERSDLDCQHRGHGDEQTAGTGSALRALRHIGGLSGRSQRVHPGSGTVCRTCAPARRAQ